MARKNKKEFANKSVKITFVETQYDSDENPLFSKVKINFLYSGKNRNGSFISKKSAERMGAKVAYIPIIGEFIKEKEDFGTHGGKITITSDDIVYEETTVPYGVVGASDNCWWEEIENEDGKMVNYLTTWGYLWTKRYPDAKKVLENNNWQSMELDYDSIEGRWVQRKGEDSFTFYIDEALVSAFCILGENIAPCYEDSQATKFTLEQRIIEDKNFAKEYAEMKEDFAQYILFTLGEEDKIDSNSIDNILEGGTDSMIYKLNIENPSTIFSSLNKEEEVTKFVLNETENSVFYYDLEDQKFYTRGFSLDEENQIVWDEEDAVISEYGALLNTALEATNSELETENESLKIDASFFEATVEDKERDIVQLEEKIVRYTTSIQGFEAIEKEQELQLKKDVILEFSELLPEEVIEAIETEIENFSIEEIKSKLGLAVYEENKGIEKVEGETITKFTHKPNKPSGGKVLPEWALLVKENKEKNKI